MNARHMHNTNAPTVGRTGAGRVTRCGGLGVLASTSAVLLISCVGSPTSTQTHAVPGSHAASVEPASTTLERLASVQRATPIVLARPPVGTPNLADTPPDPLDDPARAAATNPLTDLLTTWRAKLSTPPAQPAPDVDEEAVLQSMKLYASGRSALLAGDVAQGLRDLEAALRLAPNNPELLATLADAQLRTGRRATGLATLRRAFNAGQRDPRSMWLLARDSARTAQRDDALAMLSTAWDDRLLRDDPALALVVGADLGEALAHQGSAAASALVLSQVLSIEPASLPRTPSLPDTAEVFRRRGELLTMMGNQHAKLADTDAAITAYRESARVGSVDPAGAMARSVQMLARAGRPAEASLELLCDIDARKGALDERHALLAQYLSQPGLGVADLLARAIAERASTLEGSTPSTRLSMARLAAACQASARNATSASTALRSLLAGVPQHGPHALLLGDALDLCATPQECRDTARAVVQLDSLSADAAAEALVEHGRDVDAHVAALRASTVPADLTIASCMLRRAGKSEEALAVLGSQPADPAQARGWHAARALALADAGSQADAAAAALALINETDGASALPRAVRTIDDLRDPDATTLALRSLAGPPDIVAIQSRRAAAMIAAATARGPLAEELLLEAQHLDDKSEETYELLLALYSPAGALPDATKLTDTLRSLRQAQPGSALVRRLLAMDLVQKGLSRQAQPQLLSLVDGRGQPPSALAALVEAWERAARTDTPLADEGERWLRERAASRPQSPALLLALSRVLVANGKAQEAEDLLAARADNWPAPAILRQREFVLREGLGKAAEADALALQRLEHSPQTFDTLLERASAHFAQRRADLAAADVQRALTLAGTPARPEQAARIARVLTTIDTTALASQPRPSIRAVLACLTQAESISQGELANTLAIARIKVLAACASDETESLADAIDALRARRPSLGELSEAEARKALFGEKPGAKDPSDALRLLATLAFRSDETDRKRYVEWLYVAVFLGDGDDLRWYLDQLKDMGRASQLFQALELETTTAPELLVEPTTLDEHKGEVARLFADRATLTHRDALAADAHRTALRYTPKHPWVSNDYGYSILERGGDIAEAARLIEQAYEQLSDRASVTDSLGWLRYKQGHLDDDPARAGDVCNGLGAVSLLTKATQMDTGADNAEVIEHLGDALWRWNKGTSRADARARWSGAATLIENTLRRARSLRLPNTDPRVQSLQTDLDRLQRKLSDASAGKEPAIAPLGISPTFTPRPIPPLDDAAQPPPDEGIDLP